jgi:glyoxylase-like metal-dependent hydrolase (beta-lactamase superfamily II)
MRPIVRLLVGLVVVVVVVVTGGAVLLKARRGAATGPFPVADGVLRVRNLMTEVYAARVGGGVIVFDGGIDVGGEALDRLLVGLGARRDDVSHVFLTHGHFDHIAHAPLCSRAAIHIGAGDVALLARGGEPGKPMGRAMCRLLPAPTFSASVTHEGVATIALDGGKELLAIPAPGHTAGSYVYLFDGVLIAGDSIQVDGDHLEFAQAAFSDDPAANRRSIAALGDALRDRRVDAVCTGHQACTPEGRGRAMLDDLIRRAREPG